LELTLALLQLLQKMPLEMLGLAQRISMLHQQQMHLLQVQQPQYNAQPGTQLLEFYVQLLELHLVQPNSK